MSEPPNGGSDDSLSSDTSGDFEDSIQTSNPPHRSATNPPRDGYSGRGTGRSQIVTNQPFDEALEVSGSEEVASMLSANISDIPRPTLAARDSQRPQPFTGHGDSPPAYDEDSESYSEESATGRGAEYAGGGASRPVAASQARGKHSEGLGDSRSERKNAQLGGENRDDLESSGDEELDHPAEIEGQYNPQDYENLPVSSDLKALFQYITRYQPQIVQIEYSLRPFIPDFIPSVGDIDAFIKVPRPDLKPDNLGFVVLDEPGTVQSDPTVLDLTLRAISKQANLQPITVRHVKNAQKNPKAITKWITSLADLHKEKPLATMNYTKNFPDLEHLLQEWPIEYEELLNGVKLPLASLEIELPQYVTMICNLLDIPVYPNSLTESLHLLFSLYSEFKNSQHFGKQIHQAPPTSTLDQNLLPPEDAPPKTDPINPRQRFSLQPLAQPH
eukprot:Sdes_comp19212_c0_seq1m10085